MSVQLDLFLPNDEESLNQREIDELRDYVTRSNRAQFRRMGELGKEIIKLSDELDRVRQLLIKSHR